MSKFSLAIIAGIGTKVVSTVSVVLASVLIAYSGFVLYDTAYTDRAAFISSDLSQYRPVETEEEPTFEEVMTINKDTCAWVTMLGTHIDYPIVQGKDDVEYANKDIYGNSCLTGSIYLTTVNRNEFTDSFNLLYGHHMDNGGMFGDIEKYQDNSYFYSHQDGILVTTRGVYDIHIFGRLSADAYDSKVYQAGDRPSSDFPNYLYYLKSLSVQWDPKTDIDGITRNIQKYINARNQNIAENGRFVFKKMPEDVVKNGMQLIAFSTCADATTNGRQLLVGTMKFRTEPLPEEYLIGDRPTPLAAWGHGEAEHWSLLNAICVIMAIATTIPGKALRKKYRFVTEDLRKRTEKRKMKLNDLSDVKVVAFLGQIMLSAFALFWFIWTQNPTKPMVIVDRWTLAMIAVYAAVWVIDVYVIKNYKKKSALVSADVESNDGAAALAIGDR